LILKPIPLAFPSYPTTTYLSRGRKEEVAVMGIMGTLTQSRRNSSPAPRGELGGGSCEALNCSKFPLLRKLIPERGKRMWWTYNTAKGVASQETALKRFLQGGAFFEIL